VRAYLDRSFERLALLDPERNLRIAIARYPLDAIVDGVAIFEGKRAAGTIRARQGPRRGLESPLGVGHPVRSLRRVEEPA